MEYRTLSQSDQIGSIFWLGTMHFGWTANESIAYSLLSAAYDVGHLY